MSNIMTIKIEIPEDIDFISAFGADVKLMGEDVIVYTFMDKNNYTIKLAFGPSFRMYQIELHKNEVVAFSYYSEFLISCKIDENNGVISFVEEQNGSDTNISLHVWPEFKCSINTMSQ